MQNMYPDLFDQLLIYIEYGVKPPKYGDVETKNFGSVKGPQVCNILFLEDFTYLWGILYFLNPCFGLFTITSQISIRHY